VYLTSRKACQELGVHANTLRRWASQGKINYIKTDAGQRLYDVKHFVEKTSLLKNICYCRVSSSKQKDDLERQVQYMKERYPEYETIKDIGSGINFKRKGFKTLLEYAEKGILKEAVVAHRDRLCRFGFDLIKWFIEKNGGKLVVLEEISLSPQEELVKDLLSIINIFSCRVNGLRKYSKKVKEDKDLS
jgi:excisionase family DNA binding protein